MVDDSCKTPQSTCPPYHVLAELVAGTLSADQHAATTQHVAACPACRGMMDELRRDDEFTGAIRQALGGDEEAALRRSLTQRTAGSYEILETLGQGSGGIVFKARDLKLGRFVAIKCLVVAAEGEGLSRACDEARHLARVNHPNIAAVYAVSQEADAPYIVMEYIDGQPLTEALADRPLDQQLEAFRQALQAVGELHQRGIVHRDLKPANILVDRQGVVKIVDFGIAQASDAAWATRPQGTPAYLAPEQAMGHPAQPPADVFSLGVILFELLTGQRPFSGQGEREVVEAIRQDDPPLPRSLRQEIPGPLQAICLMALEKAPAKRYASARQFLLDLERLAHGEAVTANPTLLTTVLEHGIERHLTDLRRWQADRMISTRECDYLLDKYDHLRQREEFWVLDSRRISFSQVMLHLGAWSCIVSAFLMLAFPWSEATVARPLLTAGLLCGTLIGGLMLWRSRTKRVAIVMLMAAALTCPMAIAAVMMYFGWLDDGSPREDLLAGFLTNLQLLNATAGGLLLSLLLWWRTRTGAMVIIAAIMFVATTTAVLALAGLRMELLTRHYDVVAGWYLWPGLAMLGLAMAWDLRWKVESFARPLYIMAVVILLCSATAIAYFGPTLHWAHVLPATTGSELARQIKYSFMINGVLYLLLGFVADRSASSRWLRRIGTLMLWLAPSHVLIPILALESQWQIGDSSWTVAELLLPVGAMGFILASVPKQMKSFFFSGLLYIAIAVQRLTARHFEDVLAWPIALAVLGLLLMLAAWRYPGLFDRKRRQGDAASAAQQAAGRAA